jgi:capsular exopolysaccharide synthesis family protein
VHLQDLPRIAREQWRIVCVGVLAGFVVAILVTLTIDAKYESVVTLMPTGLTESAHIDDVDARFALAEALAPTYAELLRSRPVAEAVVQRLRLDIPAASLQDEVTVTVTPATSLIKVAARAGSAVEAQRIALAVVDEFAHRVAQLNVSAGGSAPVRVDILDAPTVPTAPIWPKPANNLIAGGLLGLLAGSARAVYRGSRDRRFRSPDEFERLSGIPVLATVPRVGHTSAGASPDLSNGAILGETYRRLRTVVLSSPGGPALPASGRPGRSILVTSPVAGDGKTTTACYLAAALAGADHRVVLVDANLRRPRIAAALGLPDTAGLTDVLAGRTGLSSTVQTVPGGRLSVLTAGHVPGEPGEFLASRAMAHLVTELDRDYDFTVVDSPGTALFADAEILSRLVHDVLLVVRYGTTPVPRVDEALHNLARVNVRPLGAVVTAAARRALRYSMSVRPVQPGHGRAAAWAPGMARVRVDVTATDAAPVAPQVLAVAQSPTNGGGS